MAESILQTIEVNGIIDQYHYLHLQEKLPVRGPLAVRVLILLPTETFAATEVDETAWLHAAAVNPAFDFLQDAEEDIYSLADGNPFHDATR